MVFATAMTVSADVITKLDDSTLVVKVLEITPTTVKYKKLSNLDGPVYSLPVAEIQTIKYDNGTVEKFNEKSIPVVRVNSNSGTVQVNNDYGNYSGYEHNTGNYYHNQAASDRKLLAMDMDWQKHLKKAKKYKSTAFIGGTCLLVGGIVTLAVYLNDNGALPYPVSIGLFGGSIVWTTTFCIMSNHEAKKAREIRNIILSETPIYQCGNTQLTAGVDMLRDRNTFAPGIGVRLSF